MGLDLRIPIGLMFGIIGTILVALGLAAAPDPKTLGVNINLGWGACLLVFAALMLLASLRPRRNEQDAPASPAKNEETP
ncbi:MAG: hypothetical protein RL095_3503 [Verrucomicrobiota bacterium]|jgi:hypothetical protein